MKNDPIDHLLRLVPGAQIPSIVAWLLARWPARYLDRRCPNEATTAKPGSDEKMQIMSDRAERRENLFHPKDPKIARHLV